jgi:hypothetical protein
MPKTARGAAPSPRASVKSPTTPPAVARVQSAVTRQNGGGTPKGSYVGRMQQTIAAKSVK